mgnify:CR=1 FL=1
MGNTIPAFAHCDVVCDDRGVYVATITNAKSLNILSSEVIQSLTDALVWIASCEEARCIILRGSGERAFIGGANIYEMADLKPEGAITFISGLRDLCEAVRNIPVPTIARLSGFCLGGGLEVAAACDIRLATTDAVFGMPEVKVGIPSVIHAAMLPKIIGPGATNWLLLTGENINAQQALDWGFVQFTCAPCDLDALIERTVAPIVSSGPTAVRQQKHLLRYWQDHNLTDGIARSVQVFGDAFRSDEPQTYMGPFLNRKKPKAD